MMVHVMEKDPTEYNGWEQVSWAGPGFVDHNAIHIYLYSYICSVSCTCVSRCHAMYFVSRDSE